MALWTYGLNPEVYDTAILSAPKVRPIKIFRYRADPIDTAQKLENVFHYSEIILTVTNSGYTTFTVLHSNFLKPSGYFTFRLVYIRFFPP